MINSYITIKSEYEYTIIEKKSEFIATIAPVKTEEEAISFVTKIKSKYPDARHNVYAYKLNISGVEVKRYSDDGEPKGTAGMPILEAIDQSGLCNVAIVVTRYFGGILLGASGLTRTYSNTAGGALNGAERVIIKLGTKMVLTSSYNLFGKIQRYLEDTSKKHDLPDFRENISVNVYVPKDEVDRFIKEVTELTSAQVSIEIKESDFMEF